MTMARFDVYENPVVSERHETPFLLDVQNEFIDGLATRIVIPLRSESLFGPRARDLSPLLTVAEASVVLDTAAMGAIPLRLLNQRVGNLHHEQLQIQSALDTLFGAF
jgi:toxin CcdB